MELVIVPTAKKLIERAIPKERSCSATMFIECEVSPTPIAEPMSKIKKLRMKTANLASIGNRRTKAKINNKIMKQILPDLNK